MENGVNRFQAWTSRPPVVHVAIGLALSILVAALDIAKPFGLSLSIFYLVPALYVGWTVPGWAAWAFQLVLAATVFLEPALTDHAATTHGSFNRIAGVIFGLLMVFLAWDRSRVIRILQQMNHQLEERVAGRTRDLEATNRSLQQEIAERIRAEAALRESEKRYRDLIELAPDGITILKDGLVAYINAAGARMVKASTPQE